MVDITDVLTKEQRSYNMSQIKGKWTKQEIKIHNLLKGKKVSHKMHPKFEGTPDILLPDSNTVVFIDGCFWHKCPKCYSEPSTNKEFWISKIEGNVKRDKKVNVILKKQGFNVVRVWEHMAKKDLGKVLTKIMQ